MSRVRVGEMLFRVPRARGHDPSRSLGGHRNVRQKLLFATNLIPGGVGTIRVGDAVTPG